MNRRTAAYLVDLAAMISFGMILICWILVLAGQHEAFWQAFMIAAVIMAVGIFINIRYNIEEDES